jgi:hypothetical protein
VLGTVGQTVLGCPQVLGILTDGGAAPCRTDTTVRRPDPPLDQFDCGSGLENWLFRAHIPRMATIVRCNCGAEYKRTEDKFLAPHTGGAVCTVCGAALEAWWESIHVPSFELVKRPDREPE